MEATMFFMRSSSVIGAMLRYMMLCKFRAIAFAMLADTPSALAYVLDRDAVCAHTARES